MLCFALCARYVKASTLFKKISLLPYHFEDTLHDYFRGFYTSNWIPDRVSSVVLTSHGRPLGMLRNDIPKIIIIWR